MPPQQRATMDRNNNHNHNMESNSDDDESHSGSNGGQPTNTNTGTTNTMRRVVSNVAIHPNDRTTSNNGYDYKVRKSSLIGYVCVCVCCK